MDNAAIAKAYGQPKVHKPRIPLRIIIASYESPAYNASIFLKNILQNIIKDIAYTTPRMQKILSRKWKMSN